MNKAWLVSSLLGVATLWVVGASMSRHNTDFEFMNGAQSLISRDTVLMSNKPTHIDTFNLHVPYDQAWCLAQDELCDRNGWKLGNHSAECQSFNLRGKCTVSIMRGKVDLNEQFVPGTDDTDTYVEIRKLKR